MYSNNNHNKWSAGQLSAIIDSIRDSNNGKCSVRMVAERIGRSEWDTWTLLHDSGLQTRLYQESLGELHEQIRKDAQTCSMDELYKRYGASWKNKKSFCNSLYKHKVLRSGRPNGPGLKASQQLQTDVSKNGYDLSTLTLKEIGEMYGLPVASLLKIAKRHGFPYKKAQRGRPRKVKP